MNSGAHHHDPDELPFVAPSRRLEWQSPFGWLVKGWRDFLRAPSISLACGLLMTLPILLTIWLTWTYGGAWLVFAMLIGFVFAAPIGCLMTYAISAQLERGIRVTLATTLKTPIERNLGTALVFALVLLVIFLVWLRAASAVSIFLPAIQGGEIAALSGYLLSVSAVSVVFLTITFMVSAFSLPMILHRDVDAITAVVTSVNATFRNLPAMMVWAGIVLLGLVLGFLTGGLSLIVILPTIGHAAWHGYLEAIDASKFPRHEFGVTSTARTQ